MPFEDPNNVSENPYASEAHFQQSGGAALAGANEDLIYETDWENPDFATQAQGANPPVTTINQSGGYATVRLNQTLYYSGSIWFQGQISGSIPAGATMRGRDENNNGIPDLFETLLRQGKIHFDS
jgi:hypothetical protein